VESQTVTRHTSLGPALHIDIQIHISPEASADQIDQIFASMAKHLYGGSIPGLFRGTEDI
jgi:glycine cleavage system regulatory protein